MKKYYIWGAIILFVAVVYFTGLYTYFIRIDVQEEVPVSSGPTESVRTIVSGIFGEIDVVHKGSGTAKLLEVNGKRILRLEDFNVTSGPDLHVYLSESKTPTGDIKSLDKYIDLGLLKGTSGNQNYEIPEPFRGYDTVVIWCQRFGVLFSYAVME